MPLESNRINWDKDSDFDFEFEIGISPKMDVKITKKDKLTYYNIIVEESMIDTYSKDIAKRYGKMTNPISSQDGDLIYCDIVQLDDNQSVMKDGIKNQATVSIDVIKDKTIKKKFIGLKKSDSVIVNVSKSFDNPADLSSMLNIKQEHLNNLV